MRGCSSPVLHRRRVGPLLLVVCCLLAFAGGRLPAQSTFGEILGTVHDSSGAVVQGAQVTLANTGTSATRTAVTDANGSYAFKNIDVGTYTLTLSAPGFEKESLPAIALTARETRRLDATLKPGAETQTVVVIEDAAPVITTDVSNLAETKIGDELVELPVAIYSRSTGSTSPISTLTTEAGVQTDDSGELAVDGTTAALLSVTIDGISSVGVEYSGPVNEMFPSFNSIEEIRVSESNTPQEGRRDSENGGLLADSPGGQALPEHTDPRSAAGRSCRGNGRSTSPSLRSLRPSGPIQPASHPSPRRGLFAAFF